MRQQCHHLMEQCQNQKVLVFLLMRQQCHHLMEQCHLCQNHKVLVFLLVRQHCQSQKVVHHLMHQHLCLNQAMILLLFLHLLQQTHWLSHQLSQLFQHLLLLVVEPGAHNNSLHLSLWFQYHLLVAQSEWMEPGFFKSIVAYCSIFMWFFFQWALVHGKTGWTNLDK